CGAFSNPAARPKAVPPVYVLVVICSTTWFDATLHGGITRPEDCAVQWARRAPRARRQRAASRRGCARLAARWSAGPRACNQRAVSEWLLGRIPPSLSRQL